MLWNDNQQLTDGLDLRAWACKKRQAYSAGRIITCRFWWRAGHLKPLGKPAQNARKWFATVEIERMICDSGWLDKAIRIVEKQIQEMNEKQKGKEAKAVLIQ